MLFTLLTVCVVLWIIWRVLDLGLALLPYETSHTAKTAHPSYSSTCSEYDCYYPAEGDTELCDYHN